MRCFAVVGAGLLSILELSSAASAADFPTPISPAAPAAVPIVTYKWTGCHVGGHVGGVLSEDRTTSALEKTASFSSADFVGGGQIGCDYQFASGWVAGVEGRASWSSLQNSHAAKVRFPSAGIVVPSEFTLGNDFLASATARLGHSFNGRWLVFVRGGAAWTEEKIDDAFTNLAGIAVDPATTTTRTGWTGGVGVEYAFSPNWSVKLEYDYYDFGSHGDKLIGVTDVILNSVNDTINEATIDLDYHF